MILFFLSLFIIGGGIVFPPLLFLGFGLLGLSFLCNWRRNTKEEKEVSGFVESVQKTYPYEVPMKEYDNSVLERMK